MTRQQFTTILILSLLAVLACGIPAPVPASIPQGDNISVYFAPPWNPAPRDRQAAVQVEPLQPLQVERRDGWKAGP